MWPINYTLLTIYWIIEGIRSKYIEATLLLVAFSKVFHYINWRKIEQKLSAYGLPKETVTAITMLYTNTKVRVRSPDTDTDFFDIVAEVLQTLAPCFFIICLDYAPRTWIDLIKNGVRLKNGTKQTISCRNYNRRVNITVWMHHMDANKTHWEKSSMRTTREFYELLWINPRNKTHKTTSLRPLPAIAKTIQCSLEDIWIPEIIPI